MKSNLKTAFGVIITLGVALGVSAAMARPDTVGGTGGGMGRHGAMSGPMHGGGGMAGEQLMTTQERDAMREKMQAAKTPEERQALAATMRADMEKRAKERGITLPEHSGPHGAMAGHEGHGGHGGSKNR